MERKLWLSERIMKQRILFLIASLLLTVAGVQTASAQMVTVNLFGGQAVKFDVSLVENITFTENNPDDQVYIEVNASNWRTAIASFNAEIKPNPILKFTSDINWALENSYQNRAITRPDGIIDFDGHTVTHMFLQNNEIGRNLLLKNGTIVGDASWHIGLDTKTEWVDFYKGTVTLENMTVPGNIFMDGHQYIIHSGNYQKIYNGTTSSCPGKLIIYGGYFGNNIHERISGGIDGTYELYGGKYAVRPEDSWCASGYSVKENTDADAETYPYIVSADE